MQISLCESQTDTRGRGCRFQDKSLISAHIRSASLSRRAHCTYAGSCGMDGCCEIHPPDFTGTASKRGHIPFAHESVKQTAENANTKHGKCNSLMLLSWRRPGQSWSSGEIQTSHPKVGELLGRLFCRRMHFFKITVSVRLEKFQFLHGHLNLGKTIDILTTYFDAKFSWVLRLSLSEPSLQLGDRHCTCLTKDDRKH